MLDKKIKKIVLTGGPCAGKTKTLDAVEKYLVNKGYYVITVPETATQLIKSKMYPLMDDANKLIFQDIVLQVQYAKEMTAVKYAQRLNTEKDVVILFDRALLDNRAYLDSQEDFDNLLKKYDLDEQKALYNYDMVIDLISTATCRSEFYELDGIRSEPIEDAALLDKQTTLAWIKHPHLVTVKPTDQLDEKVNIVIGEIENLLNGCEYNNRQLKSINTDIDFNMCNSNNCKITDVFTTYLSGDLIVNQSLYRGSSILVLKRANGSFDDKVITADEFINLINNNEIIFTEAKKEICFTENGEVYKFIKNNDRIYLDFNKSASADEAINCFNENGKRLVKSINE